MQIQLQNKKKYKTLNRPAKEILYAFSGFGPNLLMVMMGAYFQNAVNPTALSATAMATQSIGNICLIMPALFSVLWFIAKCFDGLIDIPFAAITDSLRSKYGNRRIPIAICWLPMVIAFALCWYPIKGLQENSLGNTIWIFVWALVFFASYTMCLIAYYGSLSTVCIDEKQRTRVSSIKSVFDTVSYALVYALVPVILSSTGLRINKLVYMLLPLMLTMIIPLFMIKEGVKWEAKAISQGYDITPLAQEKPVRFGESIKLTFKNKPFVKWIIVNCCSFFGLQLFLVSMNALESGLLELSGWRITVANTCAFAPVPLSLYLFNRLKANKGVRAAYQGALIAFAAAIMGFFFGSKFFIPAEYMDYRLLVACVSGIIGSFGIGAFFMMSYLVPSQVSSVEEMLTGKNHSSMYFAGQAVSTSIVGALSSSLLWENIKNIFFSTEAHGIVTAVADKQHSDAYQIAAQQFGLHSTTSVYNLGAFIVPFIVALFCLAGFLVCYAMPRRFTHEYCGMQIVGKSKYNKIKATLPKTFIVPFDKESITIFNCLWVLSASLFGIAWYVRVINSTNTFAKRIKKGWVWFAVFVPPVGAYITYKANQYANQKCKEMKIKHKKYTALIMVFSLLCLSCVSLSLIQHKLNQIAKLQNPKLRKAARIRV